MSFPRTQESRKIKAGMYEKNTRQLSHTQLNHPLSYDWLRSDTLT